MASWLLPRRLRPHVRAVYAFARGGDDLADEGDAPPAERRRALTAWEGELRAAFAGRARSAPFRALGETVRTFRLSRAPFEALLAAFRQDVEPRRYRDREEVLAYCRHSAEPVGRLLLRLFGADDPRLVPLADRICTGLQLTNFLQDLAADVARGRWYLPATDWRRHGPAPGSAPPAAPPAALGGFLREEVRWARDLLLAGAPLVTALGGRAGLEVKAIVLGALRVLRRIGRRPEAVLRGRVRLGRLERWLLPAAALGRSWPPALEVTPLPPGSPPPDVRAEVRRAGSSFYHAMRLLPRRRREALFALYAYARRLDDIVDGDGSGAEKRRRLAALEEEVETALRGRPRTPLGAALLQTVGRFPVRPEDLRTLAAGVAMDLEPRPFPTAAVLYDYCRRVAGVVGSMAVAVQGYTDPRAPRFAETLGVALQLTNILRDVGEDAARGRLYLPLEDLARFGVAPERLLAGEDPGPGFLPLLRHQAARARRWYARARELFPVRDRRRLVVSAVMGGVYRALLDRIEAEGFPVLERQVRLPRAARIATALRLYLLARVGWRYVPF